jgi:hypothetical protein
MTNKLTWKYETYNGVEEYILKHNGDTIVELVHDPDAPNEEVLLNDFSDVLSFHDLLKRFYELGQQNPNEPLEIEDVSEQENG